MSLQAVRCAMLVLLMVVVPLGARANCSALPVLTEVLDIVDALRKEPLTPDRLATVAHRLPPLNEKLQQWPLASRLQGFGLLRRRPAALVLADETVALQALAATGNISAVDSFVSTRRFARIVYQAQDLANQLCADDAESGWSRFATRIIRITGRGELGANAGSVQQLTRDIGALVLLLAVIGGLAIYRMKKSERNRRAHKRFACLIPVSVLDEGLEFDLELVDISQAGANVSNPFEWPVEHRITVQIEELTAKGTVRWSNAHYAGVLFDEQLPRDMFKELLERYPPPAPEKGPKTKRGPKTGAA